MTRFLATVNVWASNDRGMILRSETTPIRAETVTDVVTMATRAMDDSVLRCQAAQYEDLAAFVRSALPHNSIHLRVELHIEIEAVHNA